MIFSKIKNYTIRFLRKILFLSKNISLPGFQSVPIYNVVRIFYKGIINGDINTQAASIAFNFFLATPPTIIFLFTLIPYLPIENFQIELLSLVNNLLPHNAFSSINQTLEDIITQQRGDLLSFSFFAALFFSTNGIAAFISAFNSSIHLKETRSWIAQRLIAFVLVIIFSILLLFAIVSIVFWGVIMNYLTQLNVFEDNYILYLIVVTKWIIIIALFYFSISFMYYLAPSERLTFRFFSVGSTFASIMSILASVIFSFYIDNFGQYNKLYGSIGTIMVLLLWIYLNAWLILLGFDLNESVINAQKKKNLAN